MIIEKIELAYYNRIRQTGRDCSVIIMHPKTCSLFIEEIESFTNLRYTNYDKSKLKYRGTRVIRSLDVLEGIIEVI